MKIDDGLKIDTTALNALIEESEDLQVDAMRTIKDSLPALAEIREERRGEVNTDEIDTFNTHRRSLLRRMGFGASGIAARGVLGAGFGGLFAGLLATPARADTPLDVQILQTASSLERLAVNTYGVALGQGPAKLDAPAYKAVAAITVKSAQDVVTKFAMETMRQHDEHRKAFISQTQTLGGKPQDAPNRKFEPVVAKADLSTAQKLVDFAATLEKVATDTYLTNLSMLTDVKSKQIMGSVMGVEAQHLASLRAVGALLQGGAPQLIKIPIGADLANLPKAAGSVAFPDALENVNPPDLLAEPTSGDVK